MLAMMPAASEAFSTLDFLLGLSCTSERVPGKARTTKTSTSKELRTAPSPDAHLQQLSFPTSLKIYTTLETETSFQTLKLFELPEPQTLKPHEETRKPKKSQKDTPPKSKTTQI